MKTPDRYQQAEEMFHEALALAPERRAAFLDAACAADRELLAEVESLLFAHELVDHYLVAPPLKAATELLPEPESEAGADRVIGHYQILRLLGKGGMGEVWLAQDTKLDRRVAIKLLPAQFTGDAGLVRRFIQEAKAASSLNHPNILTIHEIGQQAGTHFIATEYVEGQTLRQKIRRAWLR